MKTNKILIVGGGSAGWMTAATLISQFPNKDITLIESPNTPTVGVGESTIGQINDWMALLDIRDENFMKYTDASYKLSIRFENFYKKGDGGFHYPFGRPNTNDFDKRTWYAKKQIIENTTYDDFATSLYDQMSLVNNNTIFKNENNELPTFNFKRDVAYHFDATKFGLWLKDHFCLPRGVKYIKDDINDVETDEEGIVSLNKKYFADLYIDCTGFKSLLLGKSLNEPFESYEEFLPNNSAWATRVPYKNKDKQLEPYTNCTAIENGWVWNIPSWERIGTGYVYSNKYVSDDEALNEFKRHLDEKGHDYSNSEFKNIKMRVGIHNRIFVKNVVAIGLSSGFIEPLESNGLFTTHEFLLRLVRTLGRGDKENVSNYDKDAFNLACKTQFKGFAEFVGLHYALSHREDTKYWKDISNRNFSKDMTNLKSPPYGGFYSNANDKFERQSFPEVAGINCIGVGMRYLPTDEYVNRYSDQLNSKQELIDNLTKLYYNQIVLMESHKKQWDNIAKKQLSLHQYLKKYIHN